jgi:exopolyphosphatase / guanosine-5'-triphosphate,3'-diphosphate pyrophosphatase
MKRYASIDIGTNTVLMAVCDLSDEGVFVPIADFQEFPRLGKDVDRDRVISDESLARVVNTLIGYLDQCKQMKVEEIIACGTSALRDAGNREDILHKIFVATGLKVEVLSGAEEAKYTYVGAVSGLTPGGKLTGVIDIGGGSTELSIGKGTQLMYSASIDIGCVRLTERHFLSFPPLEENIRNARNEVRDTFKKLKIPQPETMIGVAGTITTLASINLNQLKFNAEEIEGYILSLISIRELFDLFSALSLDTIRTYPQINRGREDILLAGILILSEFIELFNLSSIITSTRGLRYGIILRDSVLNQSASNRL